MRVDISNFLEGIATHEDRIIGAVYLYGETAGKKLEAEAKKNKPWKNQSSNAMNSIKGGADKEGNNVKLYLTGNMEYSKYLETMKGGSLAILEPTLSKNYQSIIRGLQVVLEK